MSCFIYGYFQCAALKDLDVIIEAVEHIGLGIEIGNELGLENFPDSYLPSIDSLTLRFEIGSKVGSNDATMLLWDDDLDPNHSIGVLPYKFEDRIRLLIKAIDRVVEYFDVNKFIIAITDSCQIESIVNCNFSDLKKTIFLSCADMCPPNRLFVFSHSGTQA